MSQSLTELVLLSFWFCCCCTVDVTSTNNTLELIRFKCCTDYTKQTRIWHHYSDLIRNSVCPWKCWQTYSATDCRQLTCQDRRHWPCCCCLLCCIATLSHANDNLCCHAKPKLWLTLILHQMRLQNVCVDAVKHDLTLLCLVLLGGTCDLLFWKQAGTLLAGS